MNSIKISILLIISFFIFTSYAHAEQSEGSRLIEILKTGDLAQKNDAREKIKKYSDPKIVNELIIAFKDQNSEFRANIAFILGELRNPNAIDPLIQALNDNDCNKVGVQAIEALGKFKEAKIVDPLIEQINQKGSCLRKSAVVILGELKADKAVESLIQILEEKEYTDEYGKYDIIKALGEIQDIRAVDPLFKILINSSNDAYVRSMAANALTNIKDQKITNLLILALENNDPDVRRLAADSLEKQHDPASIEALISIVKDTKSKVRPIAMEVLEQFFDQRVLQTFIHSLKDEDPIVRKIAAEALGVSKIPDAIEPLIAALNDDNDMVRMTVVAILNGFDDQKAKDAVKGDQQQKDLIRYYSGTYSLQRKMEVGSELKLSEDGNFEWALIYGATDLYSRGRWFYENGHIVLWSALPKEQPKFRLLKPEEENLRPAEEGMWVVAIGIPHVGPLGGVDVQFESSNGERKITESKLNGDAIWRDPPANQKWVRAGFRRGKTSEAWQWIDIPEEKSRMRVAGFTVDDVTKILPNAFQSMKLKTLEKGKLIVVEGIVKDSEYTRMP